MDENDEKITDSPQTMNINIFIPGIPKGQPRHRAFACKMGAKWRARIYPSPAGADWRARVMLALRPIAASQDGPWTGTVFLVTVFLMPRPKRLKPDNATFYAHKPDIDNLLKLVMDAVVKAGILIDDRIVVGSLVTKRYVSSTQTPGCWLAIWGVEL